MSPLSPLHLGSVLDLPNFFSLNKKKAEDKKRSNITHGDLPF